MKYVARSLFILLAFTTVAFGQDEEDIYASLRSAASRQPSYTALKTPLQTTVTDRRFYTLPAMFLSNEMNECGDPFLAKAERIGLPVREDLDFQYMTGVEAYWYSRYNMQSLITESRLGVALVHGPYVTEKALRIAGAHYNRDRAENELSNKAVLFQHLVPAYLRASGLPRRFEDASPLMLEYASGDPHFLRKVDHRDNFEISENRWREKRLQDLYGDAFQAPSHEVGIGGNQFFKYRIGYRDSFESLRWSNDRMAHFVDMGAIGQTLMKAVLWMEFFFRQTHNDRFLGIDPEEGFRGAILNLSSISKLLLLKAALLYDGDRLTGVNPFQYDPDEGLRYFPHEVSVKTRYLGDLPPRLEGLAVRDKRSLLFDQASLLWGLSEYFYFMDKNRISRGPYYDRSYQTWNRVFGNNFPYDGSVMEAKYVHLARGLADLVLKNINVMHRDPDSKILASTWSPESKTASSVTVQDLSMAIVALSSFQQYFAHAEPELAELARSILREQANFLVSRAKEAGGALAPEYRLDGSPTGGVRGSLLSQGFAVRALLAAFTQLQDPQYLRAAKKAYGFMVDTLWHARTGVFRSEPGAEVSVYTPLNLGAALGAMREYILATADVTEYERFKRFFVQAVNSSGIQQAEYEETGDDDLSQTDGDNDGIPRIEFGGDGKYGIAPVFAGRVQIHTPSGDTLPTEEQSRRELRRERQDPM